MRVAAVLRGASHLWHHQGPPGWWWGSEAHAQTPGGLPRSRLLIGFHRDCALEPLPMQRPALLAAKRAAALVLLAKGWLAPLVRLSLIHI